MRSIYFWTYVYMVQINNSKPLKIEKVCNLELVLE